jgi:endoglucanase
VSLSHDWLATVVLVLALSVACSPPPPLSAKGPRDALEDRQLWVDPRSSAALRAKELEVTDPRRAALFRQRFAEVPQALWLGGWLEDVGAAVRIAMQSAVERAEAPTFVIHDVPHLDCETTNLGRFGVERRYRQFIRDIAREIGNETAIVVLEPFAFEPFQREPCLSAEDREDMFRMLNDAVRVLRENRRTFVYLGTGTFGRAVAAVATWLASAGLSNAHGFALNVGGHAATRELVEFGHAVSARHAGAHFVIDTSQNGGSRTRKEPCDLSGLRLGTVPTLRTFDPLIDAYHWLKRPGESDGWCPRAPKAGAFWDEAALELVR